MPAHPFLVQSHLDEPRRKPAVFQIAVHVRRLACRAEQQPGLTSRIALQELCNFGVQVNFSLCSRRLEALRNLWAVFFDLLFDFDGFAFVDEVSRFNGKGLG